MRLKLNFYTNILKFNFPNIFKPSVKISNEAQQNLNSLKENGYFIFYKKFEKLADYINKNYVEPYENTGKLDIHTQKDKFIDIKKKYEGSLSKNDLDQMRLSLYLSYNDLNFAELLCNEDFTGIIYNYFKRQPYFRNQPHLVVDEFKDKTFTGISSKYHLDSNFHQLSLVLLLEDTTEFHTHTKYAVGSHKQYNYEHQLDRYSFEDEWVERTYRIDKLYGKKGSVIVFDAGNGYHKISEQPNSVRKMLFLNITCGSHIGKDKLDKKSELSYLNNVNSTASNFFNKITLS
jgi:hypothetical protein